MGLITDLPDPPWAGNTESSIRQTMLDAIDDAFNKDQGDFVYDLLTPAAMEMAQVYDALTVSLGLAFVSTASGQQLDELALNFGGGLTRAADETDDSFRARLETRLTAPRGGGNVADYASWALSVAGVGWVVAQGNWSGVGTVRVLIANDARQPASAALQTAVSDYIAARAPVGATVTIATITVVTVPVAVTVTLEAGFTLDAQKKSDISEAVQAYVTTLSPGDDLLFYEVARAVIAVPGVFNISSLLLNGVASTKAIAVTELVTATVVVS